MTDFTLWDWVFLIVGLLSMSMGMAVWLLLFSAAIGAVPKFEIVERGTTEALRKRLDDARVAWEKYKHYNTIEAMWALNAVLAGEEEK